VMFIITAKYKNVDHNNAIKTGTAVLGEIASSDIYCIPDQYCSFVQLLNLLLTSRGRSYRILGTVIGITRKIVKTILLGKARLLSSAAANHIYRLAVQMDVKMRSMLQRIKPYIALLRPHQYIKNLFVFAPPLFAVRIAEPPLLVQAFVAFAAFSLTASAVYILNDYMDIEEDRSHPVKRLRPLASGKVSKKGGAVMAGTLLACGLTVSLLQNVYLFLVIVVYALMNVMYSFYLKHVSLVDIFIIALGFVMRLFAGSVVTGIVLTMWIIIMTFLLALFLALAKRREDLLLAGDRRNVRRSIEGYNLELLNSAMTIMASVIMVSYIMYSLSPEITSKFHSKYLYVTSLFVLFGILRYMQVTFIEKKSGSPTLVLIKDRLLQLTIFLWLLSFVILIY
jgi:decaprenyl-phosphate phosphoribosyltransferase